MALSKYKRLIYNNQKLVKNFMYYIGGMMGLKSISFFLVPIYTRYLTTADYGNLELINTFIGIFSLILGLGISQYIGVEYFHYKDRERKLNIYTLVFLYIIIALPLSIVMLLLSQEISQYFYSDQVPNFIVKLSIIICYLTFFQSVYFTVLKHKQLALKLVLIQIGSGIIQAGINIYLIVVKGLKFEAVIYSQFIVILFIIISIFILKNNIISINILKSSIKRIKIFCHLKISIPLMVTALAAWVLFGADRWILKIYCTIDDIGIYSLSYRFASLFNMLILMSLSSSYSPFMYQKFQDIGVLKAEKKNVKFVIFYLLLFTIIVVLGYLIFEPLFNIIVGKNFHNAYKYILVLLFGFIFLGLTNLLTMSTIYVKRTKMTLLIYIGGAGINVILNFFLIPIYKIWGAAATTLFSYFCMAIASYFIRWQTLNQVKIREI